MELLEIKQSADQIKASVGQVIVGKEDTLDLLLVALFSSGHVLLEDVPGTGKTLIAKSLAKTVDCTFKRIQFTPDLLPTDISGIHYYNQKLGEFQFRPGPVFSHILLADEINRATPRTQSVLLECMEERQVTIDGETMPLEPPFFVVATQNPVENQGTFPLPEAQLDRFLLKIKMGYPSSEENIRMLQRFKSESPLELIRPVIDRDTLKQIQLAYSGVDVKEELLRYITEIAEQTRSHGDIVLGISPRGSQAMLKASQVFAILQGRNFVTPDDIKALVGPVFAHRILLKNELRLKPGHTETVLGQIMDNIAVPTEVALASLNG